MESSKLNTVPRTRPRQKITSSLLHIWEPDGSESVLCGDPAPVSAVGLAEAETIQSALLCPRCMERAVDAYPAVNDR
jgi:hypothetical protein